MKQAGQRGIGDKARIKPYGSWRSPITADRASRGSSAPTGPKLSGGWVWWNEVRPLDDGRQVIVRARPDGSERADVSPEGVSACTQVHEYGGGEYAVRGETLFYSAEHDGRVYRSDEGAAASHAITPKPGTPQGLRYADFCVSPDGAQIYCVRETHDGQEPRNEIVVLSSSGDEPPAVVTAGNDFYAAPRVAPGGERLAWVTWNHPRMPWDGSELWVADADGSAARRVAGGEDEAVLNPVWAPDGRLTWVSDRTGWWNLYREASAGGEPEYLCPADAEFAAPLWLLGQESYVYLDDGRIACTWMEDGFARVGVLELDGTLRELEASHVPSFFYPSISSDGQRVTYVGASPVEAPAVVVLDTASGVLDVVRRASDESVPVDYISRPEAIEFDSSGRRTNALFYPPCNPNFSAPAGEKPPLIVECHGGPTEQAEATLDLLTVQFWTTRGFAVVAVNYGGSPGFGRSYRERLRGQWGVVDLEDCTNAALHLAADGRVDANRLAIRGGSAGGYTTLCAMTFGAGVFHVGASSAGIADLETFFADTHKFESHYNAGLVPRAKMRERSPIHAVDQIRAPMIIFQGLEDTVVPVSQAELVVAALQERGIVHEYRVYEGERHGIRKATTMIDMASSALEFFGRVFGFEPHRKAETCGQ